MKNHCLRNWKKLGLASAYLVLIGCGDTEDKSDMNEDITTAEEQIPDSHFPEDIQKIAKQLHVSAAHVAKVRNLPETELQRMCEESMNQDQMYGAFDKLIAAEDLVADYLIDALLKPDAFTRRSKGADDKNCRAFQILSFLSDGAHPRLIPALKTIMQRGDPRELEIIVFSLVSFANMDVLQETQALLQSSDTRIASKARHSLLLALQRREVSPEFRTAIWAACEASFLASKSDRISPGTASNLLITLDKDRAIQTFKSHGIFDVNHPQLPSVLEEFIRIETPPDEALLLSVLDKVDYPKAYTQEKLHAAALIGLAQLKSAHAEDRIMQVLNSEKRLNERIGTAAWKARFKLAGKIPLRESALDAFFANDQKLDSLSKNEQRVCLISYADAIFSNSGIGGWFEGGDGCYTSETLEALQHFGAKEHAEIFQQINSILAPKGSIQDYEKRERILLNLSEKDSMKLDKLVDRWYKLPTWELFVNEWDWKNQENGNTK